MEEESEDMKKQLTQEEKLLAAKTKSQAIADYILDEEEALFIDGGPVDENGLPLNANVQFMTVMATQMAYIGRG